MIALEVLRIVAPVFGVLAVGLAYGRRRPLALEGLTDAAFYVFGPALSFSIMAKTRLEPAALLRLMGGATAVTLGSMALGYAASRALGLRSRGFVLVTAFANNGYMGLPLADLALGPAGLAKATVYYVTTATLHFSLGLRLVSGREQPWEMLRNPFLYATLAGMAVSWWSIPLPKPLLIWADLLGQAAIPVMLFALGYRLGTVRMTAVRLAAAASAVRIGGGLLCGYAFVRALGLGGTEAAVLLLQASMPSATVNFILAEKYRQDPQLVASAVAMSNFAAAATAPLVLAWVLPR